jgi:hypothetical protein
MAKPPPEVQAQIVALPRNDPGRGPDLLHVTLISLYDLHYAPRSTASQRHLSRSPSTGSKTARR